MNNTTATTTKTPVRTFGAPRQPRSEAAAAYQAENKALKARLAKVRNARLGYGRFDADLLKAEGAANA